MFTEKPKIRLDDVTLMRTILALLIVFMHSFTCYNGSWEQPAGYVDIPVYKWVTRTSFAFTLEAFVFMSGYLFAFQRVSLKRLENGAKLIVNKLKRLIIPSVLFSLLYFVLFYKYNGLGNMVYSIINGCGHMWYLPMLFWCFVLGWLLEQVKIKYGWKLVFLIALNLFNIIDFPLRVSSAFTYLVYFYGGYLVYKHSEKIKSLITSKRIAVSWIVFAVLFVICRPMRDVLVASDLSSDLVKLLLIVGNHACQLLYAASGLIAFYSTAVFFTQRYQLSEATKKIATCCFGIYLFQQFVLQLLYYKTDFPLWVGPYWLPWCGFIIAAVISYVLSELFLKTKIGKFLIG